MTVRTMIERVPADRQLIERLADYKRLRSQGWDVSAVVARDRTHVVLMACLVESNGCNRQ